MESENLNNLREFLTRHAYPKIATDIRYVEKIKETVIEVKDKEPPYKHILEESRQYEGDNIAEFVKEKNGQKILPLFIDLAESQLEKLICNHMEPVAYILAINPEQWQEAKKKINSFELGRIGLEIFE